MITNLMTQMIKKKRMDHAKRMLKKKFGINENLWVADCMYINQTGKKHCNATTQSTCRHCRFYSPTMEAKKKFLEKFEE